jgi:hypothetical protein
MLHEKAKSGYGPLRDLVMYIGAGGVKSLQAEGGGDKRVRYLVRTAFMIIRYFEL